MIFSELYSEVVSITDRADLVNETISAIKAATLKAHMLDFFSKDIHETGIEFTESGNIHTLDYTDIIPNFRSLAYLKRVDSATDQTGKVLEIITPAEIVDSYNRLRTDIAYIAGRSLEIRSAVSCSKFLMGCYVSPIVDQNNYSSWVAIQHPHAIIYEAVRRILMLTSQLEESNGYARLVLEEYQLLKQQALSDVGY